MSITSAEFREAAGRFTTGVAIVTTNSSHGYCGVTVSSFVSLSLDPPLISVSLAKSLRSLPGILEAASFAVSVLREDQRDIASRFARAGDDKWLGLEPSFAPSGTPWIHPSIAAFECTPYAHHEAGDHVILIGRVQHLSVSDEPPLVYYRGKLSSLPSAVHAPSG